MNASQQSMYLELPDEDQQKLEDVLEKFERSWTPQSLPDWMKQWPTKLKYLRLPALIEMVKVDLEHRLQVGEPRGLEFYLKNHSELGTPETVVGELIEAEIEALRQYGAKPRLADYQRRFPGRDAELSQWFSSDEPSSKEKNQALKDTAGTPQETPVVVGAGVAAVSLPEHFGRYRILKPIGEGGMGSVFLAHDTELNRDVALKVPHLVPGADVVVLERFQREARAAATLQHPNVCPVHDVGVINDTHYISMGYIRGRPLSDFISKAKPPAQHAAALVVRKLAKTLDYTHKHGIIHRDLKPSNVMMNEHNHPIVMDFGLARRINQSDESRMTSTGVMLGSPAYMPPEQVKGELDQLGPATDIYSLGVIFYELLTGEIPFPGDSVLAVASKIMTEEPPRPSELRQGIDPELEAICLKMMAKKIEDRYASAKEAADAITAFLKSRQENNKAVNTSEIIDREELQAPKGLEIQIQTEGSALDRLSRTEAKRQSRKWLHIAGIGLAALLLGVIFLLKTPKGTIKVELEDPTLKVIIDGETMSVEDLKSPLSIKTGKHTILVEADGKQIAPGETLSIGPDRRRQKLVVKLGNLELSGKSFEIRSGANSVLDVSWIEDQENDDPIKTRTIDLLSLVSRRTAEHGDGKWQLTENGLEGRALNGVADIEFLIDVQGSYNLHVELTREFGTFPPIITFPVGPHRCEFGCGDVVVHNGKRQAGLCFIDGKNFWDRNNNGTGTADVLVNGRRRAIDINVTVDEKIGRVEILRDGESFINWEGELTRLKNILTIPEWRSPTSISLGVKKNFTVFHKATLDF